MYSLHYSSENISREVLPEKHAPHQIMNLETMDFTLPIDTFVPSNTREIYHKCEEKHLPNFFACVHVALIAVIGILLLHLFSSSVGEHNTICTVRRKQL